MHRRHLLALTPAALAAALVGCTAVAPPKPDPVITERVAADLRLVATAMEGVLLVSSLARNYEGSKLETVARVGAAVIQIKMAAGKIAPGMTLAAATPNLRTIETALGTLVDLAATMNLPPKVQQYVATARRLLPLVELATDVHDGTGITVEDARALLQAGL